MTLIGVALPSGGKGRSPGKTDSLGVFPINEEAARLEIIAREAITETGRMITVVVVVNIGGTISSHIGPCWEV